MDKFINKVIMGDCLEKLKELPDNSVDSIVTDPPYELGFMGKTWDNTGIANNVEMWKECLRVLKPGGHLLAFSGTRTYHRMASAIEDAGFDIRDQIAWCYGQGFPKSLNISLQIKKKYNIGLCTCNVFEPMLELGYENSNNKRDNISNGEDDRLGSGKQIQHKRNDHNEMAEQVKDTHLSPDNAFRKESGVCELSEKDNKKEQGFEKVGESILQSGVCESISEDEGLRNTTLRSGLEENKTTGEREGQSMSDMQNETTDGIAGSSLNTIQNGGQEHNGEFGGSLSQLPQQDRENNRKRIEQIKNDCNNKEWNNLSRFICSKCYCIKKDIGGTALKPSIEPICMARKPLGQQELDIAKNICYNITEKGLINNSEIIWRIKNVKSAEKQKTKEISSSTELPKTVVVSAETVKMNENESVGKKIQKLIENICENGIQETGNRLEKQVQKAISKTKTEYQDTGENTNTNEKQKLLKHTEESANVAENQDLNSLPLTTLAEEEDNIEKKSKTGTSMSSLKNTDTQKMDIDFFAQTATSQWVCMDIVRTLKVNFEGKEYDFIELLDGSLVWNENLEPYRKQQKLNVAENCLKWGTGGINVDESRVGIETITVNRHSGYNSNSLVESTKGKWQGEQEQVNGRFPANLILEDCEEVRECFPETKSVKSARGVNKTTDETNSIRFGSSELSNYECGFNDSGNASRFFKSIIYQAKASKSERNKGLDSIVLVDILRVWNENNTTKEEKLIRLMVTGISPQKVIAESGVQLKNANEWNTCLFGKHLMEKYQEDIKSITKTETNSITTSQTLNWLTHLLTNEYTVGANLEMENGGNLVENVENSNTLIITINEAMALALGVKDVVSGMQLKISVKEGSNIHSTVKPIALMEYLIKMVTPKGGIVLDPFAGSGSTLVSAKQNGFNYIGIELTEEYIPIIEARLK